MMEMLSQMTIRYLFRKQEIGQSKAVEITLEWSSAYM